MKRFLDGREWFEALDCFAIARSYGLKYLVRFAANRYSSKDFRI